MSLGSADAQVANWKAINKSDATLFEQAQKVFNESDFAEARTLLGTLINTHPDSDYVPRAKLLIADSWYAEHAFKQAELEYQDFITFFPNRPEVAEAQRRVNSIRKDASF
jgi:outer membrane protein assembly factor BamD